MIRNRIAKKEVFDFKENHCDENEIIVGLVKDDLKDFFTSPILDVGAGIGDISYKAFFKKKVIMIDVNTISRHDYPCSENHQRETCDFFDFTTKKKISTLFMCHTLQFIDDDLDKLNVKVAELEPEKVILVMNTNDDFMGELISWSKEHFTNANPEYIIEGFPQGYDLIKEKPFKAKLKCLDFKTLAHQVSYLMLIDLEEQNKEEELILFLKTHLQTPEFIFNQSILIYQKS